MARRAPRAAPQFSLDLSQQPKPAADAVKDIKATQVELIVDFDAGTLDSPFIEAKSGPHFPKGAQAAAPGAATATSSAPQPKASGGGKLFRVDASTLYVFKPETDDSFIDSPAMMRAASTSSGGPPRSDAPGKGGVGIERIPFEALTMGQHLGAGAQGSVRAVTYNGRNFALKKINVNELLDKSQADVERQARKAAIVRELQMLEQNVTKICTNVVAVYNAYFRSDQQNEHDLHILMERMSISLEDLRIIVAKLPANEVTRVTQSRLNKHMQGDPAYPPGDKMSFPLSAEMVDTLCTPLPEVLVSTIARHSLKGLDHFHSVLRFVHTDIKPANLMFSEDFALLKLADFGCSLVMREDGTAQVNNVLLGTKLYMSPERARVCGYGGDGTSGGVIDAKSDIWALGVSLMEMRAGIHPCHGLREEFWNYAEKLTLENMLPPQNCSAMFHDFICQMLEYDHVKRKNARELLEHPFIKKYERVPQKLVGDVIRGLKQESLDYQRKEARKQLQSSVATATKTKDPMSYSRTHQKQWSQFVRRGRIIGDKPPDAADDERLFPPLS